MCVKPLRGIRKRVSESADCSIIEGHLIALPLNGAILVASTQLRNNPANGGRQDWRRRRFACSSVSAPSGEWRETGECAVTGPAFA